MIDTSPLRELSIAEAARVTGHARRTLLARAERESWRLHREPHRTWITVAALAEGLGVSITALMDAAGDSGALRSSGVADSPAPAVTGRGAGERRGAGPLASRRSLSNK